MRRVHFKMDKIKIDGSFIHGMQGLSERWLASRMVSV